MPVPFADVFISLSILLTPRRNFLLLLPSVRTAVVVVSVVEERVSAADPTSAGRASRR